MTFRNGLVTLFLAVLLTAESAWSFVPASTISIGRPTPGGPSTVAVRKGDLDTASFSSQRSVRLRQFGKIQDLDGEIYQENREKKAALQWATFFSSLSALATGFHVAATHEWLDISSKYWDYVAVGYPLLVITACSIHWKYIFADGSGGGTIVRLMGGEECGKEDALYRALARVSKRSCLVEERGSVPRLFVVPTTEANAFAAGTSENSVVAVTSGLVDKLTIEEVEAVLAHEVGHIRNCDVDDSIRIASMIAGLGFAMNAGDFMLRIGRTGDDDDDDSSESSGSIIPTIGLILYVTGAVSFAMATLLRLYSSRQAEFAADAYAKSVGMGPDLASALCKISNASQVQEKRDSTEGLGVMSGAYAHAYIDNPPSRESPFITMFGLLRTHPTTEERVQKLL